MVNVGEQTFVSSLTSGNGAIYFDGGTLNTGGLLAGASEIRGIGTINSKGLVSDVDLLFDAATGLHQQLNLSGLPNQNITLNLDMSSPTENFRLGAGYRSNGTLRIADGVSVDSKSGIIGYHTGSLGVATVTGAGSAWNTVYDSIVGHYGNGTLNIEAGARVDFSSTTLGNVSGSNGIAAVTGAGSTWDIGAHLMVGRSGVGRLDILDGGAVNVESNTWVGWAPSGVGEINFSGGTFNTGGLLAAPSDLHGTGTIYTRGLVSDVAVKFDATTGLLPQLVLSGMPDQNITINLDMSGFSPKGYLGAGYRGEGSLNISDGLYVRSNSGYLGYHAGSTGEASVAGVGSVWNNSRDLNVGLLGNGSLMIKEGGSVNNRDGFIGVGNGSISTVTVSGTGSEWKNTRFLQLGKGLFLSIDPTGDGILNIVNDGLVRVEGSLYVDNGSYINMRTGGSLMLAGKADNSLNDFLDLVGGSDAINFWDGTEWADINSALVGVDYTLDYYNDISNPTGYTVLTVGAQSIFDGDFDFDRDVDGADFLKWQGEDGSPSSLTDWAKNFGLPLAGDFDRDSDVDAIDLSDPLDGWDVRFGTDLNGSDFLTWQRQFGGGGSILTATQVIPEPSTVVLLSGFMGAGLLIRRGKVKAKWGPYSTFVGQMFRKPTR